MNLICIDGRLTKDPEIKMTTNNKKIISFSIANQRDKEHSDFINCVAFENNAEFLNNYFKKGDGVNITGEIRQDVYKDKNENNRYVTYVLVNKIGFPIQKKKENQNNSNTSNAGVSSIGSAKDIEISPEEFPFYN